MNRSKKNVKSINIRVIEPYLEWPFSLLLYSTNRIKKPESDLPKVVQCESKRLGI